MKNSELQNHLSITYKAIQNLQSESVTLFKDLYPKIAATNIDVTKHPEVIQRMKDFESNISNVTAKYSDYVMSGGEVESALTDDEWASLEMAYNIKKANLQYVINTMKSFYISGEPVETIQDEIQILFEQVTLIKTTFMHF